jgi:hypothetical protein
MNDDNTRDGAEPSPASAGSVANETAIDSRTLAVKLHAVAAAACYGDQAIRDWLHIAANHIALHNMGITGCGRWIPVTERLPMDGEWVLCYGWKRGREAACRSKYWDGWVSADKKNLVTHAYTHWMPLPAPPTDGK